MSETRCESCTMPIESGRYCQYCADESGRLHDFDETFARMVQFARRHDATISQSEAERRTFQFMSERPAWKDHPSVVAGVRDRAD
ncbi:MAG: hypothetical protein KDC38_03840 [Planctomycetes bacterium]|nr:hypothetical protein [Planctomycetota bacterium]